MGDAGPPGARFPAPGTAGRLDRADGETGFRRLGRLVEGTRAKQGFSELAKHLGGQCRGAGGFRHGNLLTERRDRLVETALTDQPPGLDQGQLATQVSAAVGLAG